MQKVLVLYVIMMFYSIIFLVVNNKHQPWVNTFVLFLSCLLSEKIIGQLPTVFYPHIYVHVVFCGYFHIILVKTCFWSSVNDYKYCTIIHIFYKSKQKTDLTWLDVQKSIFIQLSIPYSPQFSHLSKNMVKISPLYSSIWIVLVFGSSSSIWGGGG